MAGSNLILVGHGGAFTDSGMETIADYMKLPKSEQDELKDVGVFVAGTLEYGR